MRLITSDDRAMARLAVPALGALAAEPLYLLADTAIVGHLGTPQLAALGIAGVILTTAFTLFNFLAYSTTAQVARLHGAGEEEAAGRIAAQALWLASGLGLALLVAIAALADPLVGLFGTDEQTAGLAVSYLRIAAIGLPFALIALAGQGWLRGVADLRTPLVIVLASNAVNLVLDLWFVYGLDWGLRGSAAGTAIAQAGMGAAFAWLLLRAPVGDGGSRRPDRVAIRALARVGGHLFVRTAALTGSFAVAGAVLARVGTASLGAHQIAFQLWSFLALVLDAVAIAAQVIVGRALGAGRAAHARAAAARMIWWSVAFGALLGAVMLAALDGILIGAGDSRFLMWSMLAAAVGVFVPIALLSLALGWGIAGVWCGIVALIAARLALTLARFMRGGWAGGARGERS